jgi:hypothetical protein
MPELAHRRRFLKTMGAVASAVAAPQIVPRSVFGEAAPSNRIACPNGVARTQYNAQHHRACTGRDTTPGRARTRVLPAPLKTVCTSGHRRYGIQRKPASFMHPSTRSSGC